jgi:hypothetical protein
MLTRFLRAGALLLALVGGSLPAQVFGPLNAYPAGTSDGPTRPVRLDLDGDGDRDLLTLTQGDFVALLFNAGDGTFTAGTPLLIGGSPAGLAVGDIDLDGDTDLVVSRNATGEISVQRNLGTGIFVAPSTLGTSAFPTRVELADMNGDGAPDIVVAASPCRVHFNDGSGNFPTSVPLPVSGTVGDLDVRDVDTDGNQDIVLTIEVAPGDVRLYQFRSDGAGGLTSGWAPIPSLGGTVRVGNYVPGNGRREVAQAITSPEGLQIWDLPDVNTATPVLTLPTGAGSAPAGQESRDLDGNGSPDLVVSLRSGTDLMLFPSDGAGGFGPGELLPAGGTPGGIVLGDFNGNGLVDIVFARPASGDLGVYLQPTPPEPANFRKPMITEFSWGNPDWFEITNFQRSTVSLAGWSLEFRAGSSSTLTHTLGSTLAPGESLVVLEAGGFLPLLPGVQAETGFPSIGFAGTGTATVALRDPGGTVVDEVRMTSAPVLTPTSLGGEFRGLVLLNGISGGQGSIERVWGLDSNANADWTVQTARTSPGVENTGSGIRWNDPLPRESVLINEIDHAPDFIELVNVSGASVDLKEWFLYVSPGQGDDHSILTISTTSLVVPDGGYVVLGETPGPPAELPAGVPYVSLPLNIPYSIDEFDCALYDPRGRLIDLVRATALDTEVVHNHPRAPSGWRDFVGAAVRVSGGDEAIGRHSLVDTDTGADWRSVFTRTMGSANPSSAFVGPVGLEESFDYRINAGAFSGGFHIIVNAGSGAAGYRHSIFFSFLRSNGQGPILGLAGDALINWASLNAFDPFGGTLDADGSYRFDVPAGFLPANFPVDIVSILQDPSGLVVGITKVIEYDS